MSEPRQRSLAIVFDFDCTISTRHVYRMIHSPTQFYQKNQTPPEIAKKIDKLSKKINKLKESVEDTSSLININFDVEKDLMTVLVDYMFGGRERLELLTSFFKQHYEKADLYILSSGFLADVLIVLKILNWFDYFHGVSGQSDELLYIRGNDKVLRYIESKAAFIKKELLCRDYLTIIYVDDDHRENYELIRDREFECSTYHNLGYVKCEYKGIEHGRVKNYHFINTLVNEGNGITAQTLDIIKRIVSQYVSGGAERTYHNKYLKYKLKYIQLKQQLTR